MKQFCVYILSNKRDGVLYIGITSNLPQRIYQHRRKLFPGFSKKYGLSRLVYFEKCDNALSTISLEKRLKRWRRPWKIQLIENSNPAWKDLSSTVM